MNDGLPEKLNTVIGLVFITPEMHQVLPHYQQPFTDSNYGNVLSIWDRFFCTLKKLPANELDFGIDPYMQNEKKWEI